MDVSTDYAAAAPRDTGQSSSRGPRQVVAVLALVATLALVANVAGQAPSPPANVQVLPDSQPAARGPQAAITCPAGAVSLNAGEGSSALQTLVTNNTGATTFCIKAGTHVWTGFVQPKSGNTFIGEDGAIIDGSRTATYAFYSNNLHQSNVTIKSLEIKNFAPALNAFGAITGNDVTNWIVQNNTIHDNTLSGIMVGPGTGWQVKNNRVYANTKVGISGYKCDGAVIENNEIYGNNPTNGGTGVEAGIKVLGSANLVIRNNYSHNNGGQGIWSDTNLPGVLIEDNTVDDNTRVGIWHEISYSAIIRHNIVRRNGLAVVGGWLVGVVGIAVTNSSNVEIYGNTVLDNRGGITGMMVESGYPQGAAGPNILENLWVHDNVVRFPAGATGKNGIDSGTGASLAWYTSLNNRYNFNTYTVPSLTGQWFAWQEGFRTWAEWRAYGLDANSTIAIQ
jgi:parallel beta-helix repeat protein